MTEKSIDLKKMLVSAAPADRAALIAKALAQFVREILDIPSKETIDHNLSFFDLGLDSIVAVSLKNKIVEALVDSVEMESYEIFDAGNISKLSENIVNKLQFDGEGSSSGSSEDAKEISMEEVTRRLQEKLDKEK